MAYIDQASGSAILRIIYDGPPLSGKTETLKALGRELHGSDKPEHTPWTPDQAEGRTLFFDWLEYKGGLFQGRPVYCQIVSVPGQEVLVERRRRIVETADAVVFVVDAAEPDVQLMRASFEQLRSWLEDVGPPQVGFVIQANKQDLVKGFSGERLLRELGDLPQLTVVPSAASLGRGVREGFVTAMGLAMDRMRALGAEGRLNTATLEQCSGDELLARISVQQPAPAPPAPQPQPSANEPPPLPSSTGNGEYLWPPVQARALLHAMEAEPLRGSHLEAGHWRLQLGARWRLLAPAQPSAESADAALHRLQQTSAAHAAQKEWTGAHRCLALVEEGGAWHLWQVVRSGVTLEYVLKRIFHSDSPPYMAQELALTAAGLQRLLNAPHGCWMAGTPRLEEFSLWQGQIVYDGFLRWEAAAETPPEPPLATLRALLEAPLHRFSRDHSEQITPVLQALKSQGDALDPSLTDALRAMLIGH